MALGAIRAAAEAGLRVPDDVSVVGFDDIQLAAHVHPPLTTLRQDKVGLGAAAGDALIALIDGESDRPAAARCRSSSSSAAPRAPPGPKEVTYAPGPVAVFVALPKSFSSTQEEE